MAKMNRIIALLLATLLLLGATCVATAEEDITLAVWACNSMIDANEYKLPQEDWYISRAMVRFQELHPNVKFELSTYNDNAQVANDFKAATIAGYGPDVVCFMNGPFLESIAGGLLPMNDYVDEDMKSKLVGWDTVSQDMDTEKTVYAIPYGGQSVACFAYNKALVAKAGLDFEANPPRTLEAFYAALDALKAAGIQPLHLDESYPGLLLYCLNMWWAQKTGIDGILAHTNMETKYADDEGFAFMLNEYKKFYDNGWINEDTATSADGYNVFLQGDCALCTFGAWDLPPFREALGENLGLLAVPTVDEAFVEQKTAVGGVGACLAVANFSKNTEMAVEFAKFLASRDELIEFYKTTPAVPARTDITADDIGVADDPLFSEIVEMAGGITYWPDNCMSLDAANIFYQFPARVLVGDMTAAELAEMLDEAQED